MQELVIDFGSPVESGDKGNDRRRREEYKKKKKRKKNMYNQSTTLAKRRWLQYLSTFSALWIFVFLPPFGITLTDDIVSMYTRDNTKKEGVGGDGGGYI
jgi:hypothetical protein